MSTQRRKRLRSIVVFLAFALVQTYIQLSFAGSTSPSSAVVLPQQQILARLSTRGNRAIVINGHSAANGDTVNTGDTIETPPGTDATIDLGPLGKVDIAPGSKIKIEFECPPEEGAPGAANTPGKLDEKKCKVKVIVLAGCVAATGGKKSHVEIATEQKGRVADTDDEKGKKGGGFINYCLGPILGAAPGGGLTGTQAGLLASALIIPPTAWWVSHLGGNPSSTTP